MKNKIEEKTLKINMKTCHVNFQSVQNKIEFEKIKNWPKNILFK